MDSLLGAVDENSKKIYKNKKIIEKIHLIRPPPPQSSKDVFYLSRCSVNKNKKKKEIKKKNHFCLVF